MKYLNPHRKKQIEEFFDKSHKVMSRYYDVLETASSDEEIKKEMQRFIKEDPDFYDPYLTLAEILETEGKNQEARKLYQEAFSRAIARIVDKDGNWPKVMIWGHLENRHLIRAINCWAFQLWQEGKTDDALEIFRQLLRSNPNDNIGARFSILAIRLGLKPDYDLEFELEDMPGYCHVGKTLEWWEKNYKKFPEEFDWWIKGFGPGR